MSELNTLPTLLNDDSLKAYWRFEGSSTDETVNNNDGTDTSITYSVANGKFNQGAGFNGSSSRIALGNPASLQITNNITVSAWVKLTNNNEMYVLDKTNVGGTGGYRLAQKSGKVAFLVYDGTTYTELLGNTTLPTGQWIHIAGTYDNANVKVYLNGVSDATPSAKVGGLANTTVNAFIGTRSALDTFLNGSIDDLIIFDRSLTNSEILELYEETNKTGMFLSF